MEHHAASFRRAFRNQELADAVRADWRSAPLSPVDVALCQYAEALTLRPHTSDVDSRLQPLREVGLSDEEILRATEIVGYFNFVNRMAEGLGVELESG